MAGATLDRSMENGPGPKTKKRASPDTASTSHDESQSKRVKTDKSTEHKHKPARKPRHDAKSPRSPPKDDLNPTAGRNNELNDKNNNATTTTSTSTNLLRITETQGDIFLASPNALLIHACNCLGSWDAGIAKAFRLRYPSAFQRYQAHCKASTPAKLVGTAFLIPPCESSAKSKGGAPHFVGCLFTSKAFGRRKDSPSSILRATGPAMTDLLKRAGEWDEGKGVGEKVGEVRMCKINSGLFGVPWEETSAVLEGIEVIGRVEEVEVVSPEE